MVTRVDRLARSVFDLQDIVKTLDSKGVTLSATEQPISTKDATSKCFLDMLSVFAEFETNLRKERQMEGIAKAKEKGVYKGRKPSAKNQEVQDTQDDQRHNLPHRHSQNLRGRACGAPMEAPRCLRKWLAT